MTTKLFVYGTLQPNQSNNYLLQNIGGTFQKATVKGFYDTLGWGKTYGYPAVVLDDTGDAINGYVFTSNNLKTNWDLLDDFEGDGYKRVLTKVNVADKFVDAYIYVLNERFR